MYAHLPTEFQEIARRLARQDNQLKEQKTRGRCLSRSKSTAGRGDSRSPKRGRSRTKKSKPSGDVNTRNEVKQKKLTLESLQLVKPPCLSRSSSIRSVPTAPKISQRHPSSSKISRTPTSQSPGASRASTPRSDSKGKTKQRDLSKSKDSTSKTKENSSKLKENTSKLKENTSKLKENTSKTKENTSKQKECTSKVKEKEKENCPVIKDTNMAVKEPTPSNNLTSLCQYISENETFGSKQQIEEVDLTSNHIPTLCQPTLDNDSTQFSNNTRLQAVPAH